MLILGIILLILGFVFGIQILWTIGIILVIVGAVFWLLGGAGRPVGGRRILVLATPTFDRPGCGE